MNNEREILRHFLAAIAYRTQKAVRGASAEFANFDAGNSVRTPKELVIHMTSVLGYLRTFFIGGTYRPEPLDTMDAEVDRLHQTIKLLSQHLEDGTPLLQDMTYLRMLQGPMSDAMTHAGQIAMLRRLAGEPIPPENFIMADITSERLGVDQADPVSLDREWPEAPPNTVR